MWSSVNYKADTELKSSFSMAPIMTEYIFTEWFNLETGYSTFELAIFLEWAKTCFCFCHDLFSASLYYIGRTFTR
jgi:hypothetical protein